MGDDQVAGLAVLVRDRPCGTHARRPGFVRTLVFGYHVGVLEYVWLRPSPGSPEAQEKATTHTLVDGTPAHSFRTLLEELSTIVRNTCRAPGVRVDAQNFLVVTTPSDKQRRAFDLLGEITA